jgi:hypothetical protein
MGIAFLNIFGNWRVPDGRLCTLIADTWPVFSDTTVSDLMLAGF